MFMKTLISVSMMLAFIFTQLSHPLTMGLILLSQTLTITLITGLINESFWFSYTLFLVFIGGMLILFIYVTTLASNEMFSFSSINLSIIPMMFLLTSFYLLTNWNTPSLLPKQAIYNEMFMNLNNLFNFPENFISLMLIIYLFITLIAAVKITNISYGTMRQIQ
uniref:NADH dehydrogenase subunit 6 n=1 Tax=Puliciphora borinquenensis TaxID=92546 RepID=UPI001D12575F|nr:NADH dehydrogenase subunit 6 [Puliciphora borinquenensis]QZL38260.1 NADH dehydrogenase subunit 6 [Puliciphora borinquenensis]